MHVHIDNGIDGLSLLDEEKQVIAEITNVNTELGEWMESQALSGKHIIGLKTNTQSTELNSIAFIVAELTNLA